MIDITITATIRPELLNKTLDSFFRNCFYQFNKRNNCESNIIINIDNIGNRANTPIDVYQVCQQYSKNVLYNIPNEPNFAKAVKWCWSQCTNKYIFHLEDDWLLNRYLHLENLINYIDKGISSVRLYKRKYPSKKPYMMFDCEYDFDNDNLFIAKGNYDQFGLNPVLIDKQFIDDVLPLMVDNINPEKQFRMRNNNMKNILPRYKYGIYGKPGEKAIVTDIGTEWREKRKIQKQPGDKFLSWN
jgi:hypothetical protein